MCVAPEVSEDGVCATKGRLGIDDPVGLEKRIDEGAPGGAITQILAATGEIELVPVVRASERRDKFPAKDTTEDLHGEEEARVLRMDPPLMIEREPSRWHHTMHVRMADQWLAPRVEDAEDADLHAQVARVGRDVSQRRGTRLKQPGVQACAIA